MSGIDTERDKSNMLADERPLRLCPVCGYELYEGTTEWKIGVHVWCVQERKLKASTPIKGPSYGSQS